MFRVDLVIVPPGGGEADLRLAFDVPALPQPGDYISVRREDSPTGTEDFIVRRVRWWLNYPKSSKRNPTPMDMITADKNEKGYTKEIIVECEYAVSGWSTEEHKKSAGSDAKEFEDSAY